MKFSLVLLPLLASITFTTACAPPGPKTKVSGGNCSAEMVEHLNRMSTENYALVDSSQAGSPEKFQAECGMVKRLMKATSGCSTVDQTNTAVFVSDSDVEQFCSYDPYVFSKKDGTRLDFHFASSVN